MVVGWGGVGRVVAHVIIVSPPDFDFDWSGFRFGSKGTGLWTGLDNNSQLFITMEMVATISDVFPVCCCVMHIQT